MQFMRASSKLKSIRQFQNLFNINITANMNDHSSAFSGIHLKEVISHLLEFAPLNLAEKWDNVGLLVEPATDVYVRNILLTNDLTLDVLEEATNINAQFIISYHPTVFPSINRITSDSWKGVILSRCLMKNIAVFSPHTTWDAVEGGVNDWLAEAFDVSHIESITPPKHIHQNPSYNVTIGVLGPIKDEARKFIDDNKFEVRSFSKDCIVQIGENYIKMDKYDLDCNSSHLQLIMKFINKCEKDIYNYAVKLNEEYDSRIIMGMGRKLKLKKSVTIGEVTQLIKNHLKVDHLQIALARGHTFDTEINSIALCAGSGGSMLRNVDTDLKLTGEASHHDLLDAVEKGTTYILTRHSVSERGFLNKFKHLLHEMLQNDNVIITLSTKDKDPLFTI